ncbi:hypothetical protein VIGAN_03098200 [Vigna angularis var. angularis]|uniref:Uncharacterized protein n=1 Tax=Vigna angularis var. angularis TaxID=157739 RepID=A0A0S3RLA1_PHAAN|nr:hypothetical protein VIGAN_03098200 [Vigna angularis var. angularis]
MARNPVKSRTVTHELMTENQWISKLCDSEDVCEYFSSLFSNGVSVSIHLAEYVKSTLTSLFCVRSTTARGSFRMKTSMMRSLLYRISKWTCLKRWTLTPVGSSLSSLSNFPRKPQMDTLRFPVNLEVQFVRSNN